MLLPPMTLLSLPFLCTTVIRAQERSTKDRNQTIKVDVDQVLVNATVSDSKGRMVTGVGQGSFRHWEDKVEQKVEYNQRRQVAQHPVKINPPQRIPELLSP